MPKVATFSSTMFQESYCNNPLKICYGPIASIELQKRWTEWAKKLNCIQCPLDIATLDKAAALPIATPVTDLCHYINSNLVYNDLNI